ncbi:MAG: serine hydrolase [Erysipelotrichaceae bacterium]|nr:serine hydrolase [Erysipelotrichaceae bacterium]
MDLRIQKNALNLGNALLNRKTTVKPFVPFISQKPAFLSYENSLDFNYATPEETGISSSIIKDFIKELNNDASTAIHSLIIVKNNNTILEMTNKPYKIDYWRYTFSLSKSITALAIGMLIDDGLLNVNDSITKYLGDHMSPLDKLKFRDITIEHLLTMSSGFTFNELGAVTINDWLRGIISTSLKWPAGSQFEYNSMNSYLLAVVVCRITGSSLMCFLEKRLWSILDIKNVYWDKCPFGIEKGGWGLYLSPKDMAKLGVLFLNKGKWDNKQVISEKWLNEMITPRFNTSEHFGDYDYGYQIWIKKDNKAFLMNGMFGQNVLVIPKNNIVVVTCAGNQDSFQTNNFFKLANKYFIQNNFNDANIKKNKKDNNELKQLISDNATYKTQKNKTNKGWHKIIAHFIKKDDQLPTYLQQINGNVYEFDHKEYQGIGFIPLLMRGYLNNHTSGIISLQVLSHLDSLTLKIQEQDSVFEIFVSLSKVTHQTINYHNDQYEIGVLASFNHDEDDNPVLKLQISFIEYPNTRHLKLRFLNDKIQLEMSEFPGLKYVEKGLDRFNRNSKEIKLVDMFTNKFDLDYLKYKAETVLMPVLIGTIKSKEEHS